MRPYLVALVELIADVAPALLFATLVVTSTGRLVVDFAGVVQG